MKKAFLPWLGGKSQLSKQISSYLNHIPHSCYVEPFMGAAHVFFRKNQVKTEVLNDINKDLTTLFRVLQYHLEEFLRYYKWTLCSRDDFQRLKELNPDSLTDIQRAARFYYIQKLAFGGHVKNPNFGTATTSPPRLNLFRIEEELSQVHIRLHRVLIENLGWSEVIKRYDRPHTLFYVDSPYFGNENDYGKNLFPRTDFPKLAKQLGAIKGNFVLSINDKPEIREIFRDFFLIPVQVRYSIGKTGKNNKFAELIISNVELQSIERLVS